MTADIRLIHGSSPEALRDLADNSVDSIVTDPPYGLSFMGKTWDYDVPSVDVWRECLRVLKPGGHLLAFAGTRTQHRMAVRIEDAGFEIRDMIAWVYGSGFPKSLDVSKAIDGMDAAEEQRARRFRFTEWVRSTGIIAAQIDVLTGTRMGHHYTTHPTQPAIMTREHLEACRMFLGDIPEWVERECDIRSVESRNMAAREVVGVEMLPDTSVVRAGFVGMTAPNGVIPKRSVNITTPATDLARQWQGWGTALKPALEPITVARKPLDGTVAETVLRWGTGGINVDGCRVPHAGADDLAVSLSKNPGRSDTVTSEVYGAGRPQQTVNTSGRFPANLIHDGSAEVVGLFPGELEGSASRFFYCAKASKVDRDDGCGHLAPKTAGEMTGGREEGSAGLDSPRSGAGRRREETRNHHPTVKPTDLMRYLCRLVTPPGGVILDPFMGSGSTGRGAVLEGFRFIGVEREADYIEIARARITAVAPEPEPDGVKPATGQLALF